MAKNLPAMQEDLGSNPWVRKIPWGRKWQSTPVFLPGEFHGQRSLMGYSSWGHKESDTAERLTLSLFSCAKQTASGRLLYNTESSTWCPVMT